MRKIIVLVIITVFASFCATPIRAAQKDFNDLEEGIKAYCIDFNWGDGGPNAFARPGLWADADPNEHLAWYKSIGANVIQTFAVSCNGYAWYKDGVVPTQPGLKYDFLTEMVKLGHKENMMVFGYFCVGANTRWGQLHPDQSYGVPSDGHIPLTMKYNDYLCGAVADALKKTDMDGFMLDWFFHGPIHKTEIRWLDCEIEMWAELMDSPFPGKDKVTKQQELDFARRSVDRCWRHVRAAAKSAKPDCIIWLSLYNLNHQQVVNSNLVKEVDWLMNEGGTVEELVKTRKELGRGNLINCLAAWNNADPRSAVPESLRAGFGLYGFTKPVTGSLLPSIDDYYLARDIDELTGDEANIAMLARAYRGLNFPVGPISQNKPVIASSTWADDKGYEPDKINDGKRDSRWGAFKDVKSAWVEIDLQTDMDICKVKIFELADRVKAFVIEYRSDKNKPWKTALSGSNIGNVYIKDFAPVKGRYFRLNITDSAAEPTIWEFQLYSAEKPQN